ncbi:hypothetical protein [Terriglobus sp. RCC_193]|uniref:hypothetical protein n=1 Tax=Terriglobus sp. RCC_193 TaxID=3239218 RepID=UPI00352596DC
MAVPLLAFVMPLQVAAPLAVLLSIAAAAVVVVQDWKHIHLKSAAGLLAATVFGIPIGLLLLTNPHQQINSESMSRHSDHAVLGLFVVDVWLVSSQA